MVLISTPQTHMSSLITLPCSWHRLASFGGLTRRRCNLRPIANHQGLCDIARSYLRPWTRVRIWVWHHQRVYRTPRNQQPPTHFVSCTQHCFWWRSIVEWSVYGSGRENCAMSLTSSPNVLPLKIDNDTSTCVWPKNNEVRRYTLGLDTTALNSNTEVWVTVGLMEMELPRRSATTYIDF